MTSYPASASNSRPYLERKALRTDGSDTDYHKPNRRQLATPRSSSALSRDRYRALFPQSGPTARATLAWGNAPGHRTHKRCGLKARARRLIPHKPLIKADPILAKHRPHLRLEIRPPMMLRLPIDVPHQRPRSTNPTENAAYPRCHPNLANSGPFVLIHFDDDTFNRSTNLASDSVRPRNIATCT